jgi:hypothetical protein
LLGGRRGRRGRERGEEERKAGEEGGEKEIWVDIGGIDVGRGKERDGIGREMDDATLLENHITILTRTLRRRSV